ncbi:MAG: N-acetyl sugar amidotransferase [Rickettsiales bacterium]
MTQPPNYRQCTRCVMDTSDPAITFDAGGVCNHCHQFDTFWQPRWHPDAEGARRLEAMLAGVRRAGQGRDYDCVIGLSGGIDSAYLAVKAREWNLRPLVVHVDCGWNSELAVHNIEAVVKHCGYDLHTAVVDWEEVKDLQLAYLRSGVANQDVPQDHAFFAGLYGEAVKHNIQYVLSGGNIATEATFPKAWHGDAMDVRNLRAIHKRFGHGKLRSYPTVSFFDYYIGYPFLHRMKVLRPLNFMEYDKRAAMRELVEQVGYKEYGRKHGESIFTRFFQNHYLPARFGMDKRLAHYSSMIHSGQISRAQAVQALAEPLYDARELESDIAYFCKKLSLTRAEFDALMAAPKHDWRDYPNNERYYLALKKMQGLVKRLLGREVSVYA